LPHIVHILFTMSVSEQSRKCKAAIVESKVETQNASTA
jgi:hypothetical protein